MSDPREAQPSGAPPHFYNQAIVLGGLYALPFLALAMAIPFEESLVIISFIAGCVPPLWMTAIVFWQVRRIKQRYGVPPEGARWVLVSPILGALLLCTLIGLAMYEAAQDAEEKREIEKTRQELSEGLGALHDGLMGMVETLSEDSMPPSADEDAPSSDEPVYLVRASLMYYDDPPTSPRQRVGTIEGPVFFRVISTRTFQQERWHNVRITPLRGAQFVAWLSDNSMRIAAPEPMTEEQARQEHARLRGGD